MNSYRIITKYNKFSLNNNKIISSKNFYNFNHLLLCNLKFNNYKINDFTYLSNKNFNKEFHIDVKSNNEISLDDLDFFRKEFINNHDTNVSIEILLKDNNVEFFHNNDIFLL